MTDTSHSPVRGRRKWIVAAVTVMVLVIGVMTFYWLTHVRELAGPSMCRANLMGIGTSLWTYANDYGGALPPNLDVLLAEGSIVERQLHCDVGDENAYLYIPGQSTTAPASTPVAFELLENHGDGAHVLFVDGHVEFLEPPKLDIILAPYRAVATQATTRPAWYKPQP
ncbi:MAG: hypothetical protein JXA69_20210 [Phycisphaerae bacterium]|nr:hypothetical protein [Phycisphaerae bacterium]